MQQYLFNAGFPQSQLAMGGAIGMAESSGNTNAINHDSNGTTDYGFMQINTVNGGSTASFDPQTCANQAYKVYQSQGWGDGKGSGWSTYDNSAYKAYLVQSTAALAGKTLTKQNTAGTEGSGTGATSNTELVDIVKQLSDAQGVFRALAHVLTTPHVWLRAAKIFIGMILITWGLFFIVKATDAGNKAIKTTTNVGKKTVEAGVALL